MLEQHLMLESGRTLASPPCTTRSTGRLNAARDNAVLICHALSGSARVGDWWPEIFAPGALLSLEHDFVICINLLGSCYGSTGPGSVDPGNRACVRPRLSPCFHSRQCPSPGPPAGLAGDSTAAADPGRLHWRDAGAGVGDVDPGTCGARGLLSRWLRFRRWGWL